MKRSYERMLSVGEVSLASLDEQDKPIVFPAHERRSLRLETSPQTVTVPLVRPLPLVPAPREFEQETIVEAHGSCAMRTQNVPELQPFPYKRTLTLELPIPPWIRALDTAAVTVQLSVGLPAEQVDEEHLESVVAWTLSVNTRTLFQQALPTLSALLLGAGSRPHYWTVAIAGFLLADHRRRPFEISLSLGFRSSQLVDQNITVYPEVHYDVSDFRMRPVGSADSEEEGEDDFGFEVV